MDASVVLAYLKKEAGAEIAATYMTGASISAVNFAEVVSRLSDRGLTAQECGLLLSALNLDVVPFDEKCAFEVGNLRGATRAHGLSLGDRACLALARSRGWPAVTADRAWKSLRLDVDVQLIR